MQKFDGLPLVSAGLGSVPERLIYSPVVRDSPDV